MTPEWTDDQPIYRQLRDKVVAAIMDGTLGEGQALPSVRSVAVDMQINPLTASKAYQELVMDGLVEKRRGLGMFVIDGARENLLEAERRRFLNEEWPRIVDTIRRLGLAPSDLVADIETPAKGANGHKNGDTSGRGQ
ncbi:GntR family transcriptional regulator [Eilatimonas milleporae]|uniref:GntR family transcriptional regulator n=1 Tax=Eilatimonas milleporae TaxID=911205 RepID=A0A3M0C791_9PROT|nr:GntR family transcriptional regulator [Eilatimonas milleporae]RMB04567.1 GntR family transcriptional regulator [Eilatimonas milleporae]